MRKIAIIAIAGFCLSASAATGALAMGGEGGPSDAWGSPYVLYIPQTFRAPPGWGPLEGRSAYEGPRVRLDCRGDRACERRARRGVYGAPAPQ